MVSSSPRALRLVPLPLVLRVLPSLLLALVLALLLALASATLVRRRSEDLWILLNFLAWKTRSLAEQKVYLNAMRRMAVAICILYKTVV